MNAAEELTRRLTEGAEDFDPRAYFRGVLTALEDRGFERVHLDEPYEQWMCEKFLPFRIWTGRYSDTDIVVSVEHDNRMERTPIQQWEYPMDALDAALAQVDRIIQLMEHAPGQTFHERHAYIWQALQKMQEAPMLGEADEDDLTGYLDYESQLKQMGFEYRERVGCYTKSYTLTQDSQRYVGLSLALFYNFHHAFVDVYISAADADPHATRASDYQLIKVLKDIPAGEVYTYVDRVSRVAQKLRDTGVTSAKQVVAQAKAEHLLEAEQEFDPREYFLGNPVGDTLKRLGYTKFSETSDSYTKQLFEDRGLSFYLTVYGAEFPGDPTTVVIEYQRHVVPAGFSFPWNAKVDNTRLAALLPVLESAIKSAWEQAMSLEQTKAVLDALVKA